ncbi:integrase catalytic domain-containing protein [Trichonephila clavipes]|nr:integrase catalytic domain-containing protein [Trichonephila clavipes]
MLNLHINGTNIDNQLQDFGPKAESNFDEASDGIKVEQKSDSLFNLFTHRSSEFGIDYVGPVLIKCNKGRGTKSTKGYVALFVCLATIAVHIEAVGDLTTDSFIAALRRFSALRGASRHIYDNGTNFVGARRKLDKIRKLWLSLPTNEAISYYLSKSSIDWHPHHHILEVFGNQEFDPSNFIRRECWQKPY